MVTYESTSFRGSAPFDQVLREPRLFHIFKTHFNTQKRAHTALMAFLHIYDSSQIQIWKHPSITVYGNNGKKTVELPKSNLKTIFALPLIPLTTPDVLGRVLNGVLNTVIHILILETIKIALIFYLFFFFFKLFT